MCWVRAASGSGFIAVLLLFAANYLLARVVGLFIDQLMQRKGGAPILMVLIMTLCVPALGGRAAAREEPRDGGRDGAASSVHAAVRRGRRDDSPGSGGRQRPGHHRDLDPRTGRASGVARKASAAAPGHRIRQDRMGQPVRSRGRALRTANGSAGRPLAALLRPQQPDPDAVPDFAARCSPFSPFRWASGWGRTACSSPLSAPFRWRPSSAPRASR